VQTSMPASRPVVSAGLQERFGHPDRAASVRQHRCPPPATSRLAHPATDPGYGPRGPCLRWVSRPSEVGPDLPAVGRDWPSVSLKLCPGRAITVARRSIMAATAHAVPPIHSSESCRRSNKGVGDGVEGC